MTDAFYQLWFAVRYVHVASAALLAGGALAVCALCLCTAADRDAGAAMRLAPIYEWLFWSLAGVIVVTGVSNLGLKGDGLMPPHTTWGRALTTKLGAVLLLLALSLLRSDFVLRCGASGQAAVSARARLVLGWLYGLTVANLLGALWLGLGLAHGRY